MYQLFFFLLFNIIKVLVLGEKLILPCPILLDILTAQKKNMFLDK